MQCPRCRRTVAANFRICPHCDFHREQEKTVPRSRLLAHSSGQPVARASRRPEQRTRLRVVLAVVLAVLAIGGYVSVGTPGLDAPPKAHDSTHVPSAVDEHPNAPQAKTGQTQAAPRRRRGVLNANGRSVAR
ncbi:hypothetical protein AWB78_07756 [Caballeronia calidae]|uniref:C2H2-type domain-containing protein n=1 Tax=Caballeronia calidae TaxID=1777139 RepID=A0A158EGE5_9BURK|nr:hypothetical protein AWB78_07756 [Caballeronia calidae]